MRKHIIKYTLKCKTGLQIGAGSNSFEIGGVDNPVIKNPITGEPIIPGSSIKGKMRSLLELSILSCNNEALKKYNDSKNSNIVLHKDASKIQKLFGLAADRNGNSDGEIKTTRSIFRDLNLKQNSIEELEVYLGKGVYTEIKAENNIDRLLSSATPRFFERVPAGVEFEGEIIITTHPKNNDEKNKYLECKEMLGLLADAIELLEDDYLGANGSRGYGKVKIIIESITTKEVSEEGYKKIKYVEENIDIRYYAEELMKLPKMGDTSEN